jgi:hypothetical protein
MTTHRRTVIALTGRAGAGKDTAADAFPDAVRLSFAGPLKEACMQLWGFTHEQMYGSGKDKVDPRYGETPRQKLQKLGTEFLREDTPGRIVQSMYERIRAQHPRDLIVITDLRFNDEAEMLAEKFGARIIKVLRASLGERSDAHASEDGIDPVFVRYIACNDGTIEQLHLQVNQVRDIAERDVGWWGK